MFAAHSCSGSYIKGKKWWKIHVCFFLAAQKGALQVKVALGIARAQCRRAAPASEVGALVLALPCMCAGLREHLRDLPNPLGERMDTSHPWGNAAPS